MTQEQRRQDSTIILAGTAILVAVLMVFGWNAGIQLVELGNFGLLLVRNLGALLFLIVSAFGFGAVAVHWIGLRDRTAPEFYLFSIALGLAVEAHVTLGLAALGLLYKVVAYALPVAGVLIGLFDLTRHWDAYRDLLKQPRLGGAASWFSLSLVLLLALSWLYPLFSTALVPPHDWDEVAYHLAIPELYIDSHALTYIPFIPYSNWPLETEMLFTLSLLLDCELLPHLISWSALLLTSWGIYLLGRRFLQRSVGLLAAAIFSSTPMVGTLAGTALIELPLTLYTFLAAFAFLIWLDTEETRFWMLAALTGGVAASTKLNGALVPLILGLFLALAGLIQRRAKPGIVAKRFVLFGLLAFAVVAPWYAKTWAQTGNPFWPFLHGILGGRNWDALGNDYLLGFIRLPNMPLTLRNWLLGLKRLTFESGFGPERVTLGWHYLVALPLVLPALVFPQSTRRRMTPWLAGLGLAFYTAWFFQTHQTRFLMPTTPILALLAAAGLAWLWSTRSRLWRGLIQSLIVLCLTITSWIATPSDRAHVASRWAFLSGESSRHEFLTDEVPGYETYAYANEHLPEDARVLLALYECRGYYLERDYVWANPISQRFLRLEEFSSPEQLADELQALGFTHVIFRSARLDRYTYIRHGKAITDLFRSFLAEEAQLVYTSSELSLYEIKP